jgi:hypothetical protein
MERARQCILTCYNNNGVGDFMGKFLENHEDIITR